MVIVRVTNRVSGASIKPWAAHEGHRIIRNCCHTHWGTRWCADWDGGCCEISCWTGAKRRNSKSLEKNKLHWIRDGFKASCPNPGLTS